MAILPSASLRRPDRAGASEYRQPPNCNLQSQFGADKAAGGTPAIPVWKSCRYRLFRRLRHLLQIGRVFEVNRRVALERVFEPQFLADLAHRRHHLLAEEANAGPCILVADRAVIAPDPVDARPGFF